MWDISEHKQHDVMNRAKIICSIIISKPIKHLEATSWEMRDKLLQGMPDVSEQ